MQLAVRYGILAVIATAANLGSQALSILIYAGPYSVPVSILVGTGIGLLLKYVLDKRYIFRFQARDLRHDANIFILYAVTGLAMTIGFWAIELSFYAIFGTAGMRYLGGLCALAAGYFFKFRLDKRYVFVVRTAS